MRARRELLLSKDLRPSLLTWGVCSKRRAHFNFNAECKLVFWQARCAESCARSYSFVRARREPLDDQVNPGHGLFRFLRPRSGSSEVKNYQYQNILDRFKTKTLIVQTNQIELSLKWPSTSQCLKLFEDIIYCRSRFASFFGFFCSNRCFCF